MASPVQLVSVSAFSRHGPPSDCATLTTFSFSGDFVAGVSVSCWLLLFVLTDTHRSPV